MQATATKRPNRRLHRPNVTLGGIAIFTPWLAVQGSSLNSFGSGAMDAAMRQRVGLAEPMLQEHAPRSNVDQVRQEAMNEFQVVLTQMRHVGGEGQRMRDLFMRLLGFMAMGRVLSTPTQAHVEP